MSLPIIDEINDWTFNAALPFWAEEGPDRQFGGFIEELTFAGKDAAHDYKRVRVTCRQIYSFAHAVTMGWHDGKHLIAEGADYLIDKAWAGEGKGFVRLLTREGAVKDPTIDLYDNAFALFAFAWAYKATGDAAYRDWAVKTMDTIEASLRHPTGKGFWHWSEPDGHRQQNPHMHLFEASLVAFEATGDERFKAQAEELAGLFASHFFNRKVGALTEFFEDDWSIAKSDKGAIVEPGHQLEWAWILHTHMKLIGGDYAQEIKALVASAEKYGINPKDGAVYNSVTVDGTPLNAGSRSWPNTERLKAGVALHEMGEGDPIAMINGSGRVLLDRYLSSSADINIPRGGWIDAFDENSNATAKTMPASILYHMLLAFAEVLRIGDTLKGDPA